MNRFSLSDLLDSAGKRMSSDLAERLVAHPGEKGMGREQIIRQFLLSYLPKKFEIATGFAFDFSGAVSKQLDLVIANSLVCPRFETSGGNRFYPCESVVAVGQIRSSLRSRRDFRDALSNLESVKALDRSAGGKALDTEHNETIDHRNNYLHQIFTFLIVTGRALSGENLCYELIEYLETHEPFVWPNIVLVLDKYLVTYACDDGICPNAMHARGVAFQSASRRPDLLMRFYLLLGRAIEVTRVTSLPYWEYLQQANTWDAKVWYSSADDPPPLLRQIPRR
jgi:uncharacterized protein DUF6602